MNKILCYLIVLSLSLCQKPSSGIGLIKNIILPGWGFSESDEYVTVPEFPLGTGLLLIVSVSSYILFSKNPEKVVNAVSCITNTRKLRGKKQD